MILLNWLKGVFRQRWGRLLGSICGVAITISLLASIGIFISYSGATMTKRAIADIPVDWQIQTVAASDINHVADAVGKTTDYTNLEKVGYADTAGFEATTDGTVQTTGPGKVLGISEQYNKNYPGEIRQLVGEVQGVLVAQQTAANLHIKIGDMVTIMRVGQQATQVKVDGVVDLPNADSLFQAIGLPPGAAPQAPPDNVLLLPIDMWHQIFDTQAASRPDTVHMQLHARIKHDFPADPNAAFAYVQHLGNNLEARIAGSGIVGNNIAARLDSVRGDALYSKILFLFLGLPGAILAVLLTLFVAASGTKHRGQEQALLRVKGASIGQILTLEALEAFAAGIGGIMLGMVLTYMAVKSVLPKDVVISGPGVLWIIISITFGLVTALAAILLPAWRQARLLSISSTKTVRKTAVPLWQRLYIDIIILAISFIEFWRTASTGYKIVLAPEGVTAISVNYEAFIAPVCLWIGGVLLAIRLIGICINNKNGIMSKILLPVAKKLSAIVAASISRERIFLIRGIILVALAVSFAVSTSIFNATYNAQARVDAELTNGSDVTITGTVPFEPGDKRVSELKTLHGVGGMQLMQHRFAYVGTDLQDIYGIDPSHITDATNISDAYFANGDAKETLSALKQHPDGILVSEETVTDFQLKPGDQINLRLQSYKDHQYHVVPFHFVGIVREFPTAPTDSFLVANSSYISQMTGSSNSEVILMRAAGNPSELAKSAEKIIGTLGGKVTDIGSTQKVINSSLTSIDLHGLTTLELVFAIILVAGAVGLVLALGLAERRRSFAILTALGAKEKQLDSFIWSEGLLMLSGGGIIGAILGVGVAQMLVKVLTGVFDPPPEHLLMPWGYITILAAAAAVATILAVSAVKRATKSPVVNELKNL